MESRKRKAAASIDDGSVAKRHKSPQQESPSVDYAEIPIDYDELPGYVRTNETAQGTTLTGLRFVQQLRAVRDKTGREIADWFFDLPDKHEHELYYRFTHFPLSINIIETKLNRGKYPHLSALESDVKRLVHNAKAYNESSSVIFQDAERVRKNTSNWMVKHNPAYKANAGYVSFPTPTEPALEWRRKMGELVDTNAAVPRTISLAPKTSQIQQASPESQPEIKVKRTEKTPAAAGAQSIDPDDDAYDGTFDGKTFQLAQEQIMNEMIKHQDEDGYAMFEIFHNLPSRSLTDYYEKIKNPTSLKGIQKKVKGMRGKGETTGHSDYRSWAALENDMAKIWYNARDYNIDGSEIFLLSEELEKYFKGRLKAAKRVVDEPQQPTLKLNMQPAPGPIKLRLGPSKESPAPSQSAKADSPATATVQSGVSVDRTALERQRRLVQAGVNGNNNAHLENGAGHSRSHDVPADSARRSSSHTTGATPAPINGIKSETSRGQSPAVNGQPHIQPHGQLPNGHQVNGIDTSAYSNMPNGQYVVPPVNVLDKFRPEGKDAADALLQNISLQTHPDLRFTKSHVLDVRPHDYLSHQSATVNLPSSFYLLRIEPTLSESLGTMATGGGRPYKLFVTVNGQRVAANNLQSALQYDVRLLQGVNRIEVECVTLPSPPRNVAAAQPVSNELEVEKTNIFVNLLRA